MGFRPLGVLLVAASVSFACSSTGDASSPTRSTDAAADATGDAGLTRSMDAAADTVVSHDAAAPDGPTPEAEAGDPNDASCTALATASCNKAAECNPSIIKGQFGSLATCIERRKISCLGSAAAPGSGFDPTLVNACAASIPSETCMQAAHGPHATACAQKGSLDEGAPCGFGLQCKSGNCDLASGTSCSTCTKPLLPLGSPCTGFQCESGLQCVANTCVRASNTGGPCSATQPCWIGAICLAGTCVARANKGESCATIDCDGRLGLACDTATKTCVETVIPALGGACGPPNCGAGICKPTSDSGPAGICVARIADGMPCDAASGNPCLQASACTGGKCTPFDATNCR